MDEQELLVDKVQWAGAQARGIIASLVVQWTGQGHVTFRVDGI